MDLSVHAHPPYGVLIGVVRQLFSEAPSEGRTEMVDQHLPLFEGQPGVEHDFVLFEEFVVPEKHREERVDSDSLNSIYLFVGSRKEKRDVFLSLIDDLLLSFLLKYSDSVVEKSLGKDGDLIAVVEGIAAVPNAVPPFLKLGLRALLG